MDIRDGNGKVIGRVEGSGELWDTNGNRLGKLDNDGELFNSSGSHVANGITNAKDALEQLLVRR
jgi:YD repeat-containing protein